MQVESVKNCDRSFPRADGNGLGCCDGDINHSYFKDSSNLENPHLRTFAYALALSFNPTHKKETVNYISY